MQVRLVKSGIGRVVVVLELIHLNWIVLVAIIFVIIVVIIDILIALL
jgi:hypothetical protein